MKKIDIVGIAFGNFKRRKLRSVLTVLGVVIGTASIVTMMSLGIAIDESFSKSMQSIGDLTTVNVYPGWDPNTGQQTGNLDDKLIEQLKTLSNVAGVSPEIQISGKVVSGRYQWYANIMGIDMSNAEHYGFKAAQGELFNEEILSSVSGKTVPILFGAETAYRFQKPQRGGRGGSVSYMIGGMGMAGGDGEEAKPAPEVDLMDPASRLRYTFDWSYGENNGDPNRKKAPLYSVQTVGILEKSNGESDYSAYMDIETAKKIKAAEAKYNQSSQGGNKKTKLTYDSVKVFADKMENTEAIVKAITDMGYQAWGNGQYITQAKQQTAMIQMFLGGIGAVSLLVAAIGITNTMVMSIYERTREIGIMKVIGCYLKDIRTMFLVEAGFIGFFGGLVGVAISYGLSILLNWLASSGGSALGGMFGMGGAGSKLSVIPAWLALIAIIFAILVALVSGFFPARRAMKLSALEAMKT